MSCLLDEGELPTRGGQRPHLVLTMGLSELVTGLGTATLDTGGCLSAAEARRLACDAAIIPMVLGSDSMPLDVGRQHRPAIRDALAQRDQGCAFPGCDRSPRYCQAHHLCHWLDWARQKSTTCAYCVSTITLSCIARDGTSDSTPAVTPNLFFLRPWTLLGDHSTIHSGGEHHSVRNLPCGEERGSPLIVRGLLPSRRVDATPIQGGVVDGWVGGALGVGSLAVLAVSRLRRRCNAGRRSGGG